MHYHASAESEQTLEPNSLYLIDSGAQYLDGTTDITRTIAIGTPTAEMKDRYTRVLKGHIALSRALFPKGTTGSQLDVLARHALWQVGLDYDHGTGHGVGCYLGVHEGPHGIAKVPRPQPLLPGMVLSNEPGYYKTGGYGIRIENLVVVAPVEIPGAERETYGFETLTPMPDRQAADRAEPARRRRDRLARRLPPARQGGDPAPARRAGGAGLAGTGDRATRRVAARPLPQALDIDDRLLRCAGDIGGAEFGRRWRSAVLDAVRIEKLPDDR